MFVQCGKGGWGLQMRTSALFGAKKLQIYLHLHGLGEESIFRDFVRTSFMDGL